VHGARRGASLLRRLRRRQVQHLPCRLHTPCDLSLGSGSETDSLGNRQTIPSRSTVKKRSSVFTPTLKTLQSSRLLFPRANLSKTPIACAATPCIPLTRQESIKLPFGRERILTSVVRRDERVPFWTYLVLISRIAHKSGILCCVFAMYNPLTAVLAAGLAACAYLRSGQAADDLFMASKKLLLSKSP
jgi:hypothetical protein